MSISDDQQGGVIAYAADAGFLRTAVQQHAEASAMWVLPILRRHFLAAWCQPGNVFDADLLVVRAREEPAAPQHGQRPADHQKLAHELGLGAAVGSDPFPV